MRPLEAPGSSSTGVRVGSGVGDRGVAGQPSSGPAIGSLVGAMVSIQCGASLAKSLFPTFGSEGATALRLGLAAGLLLATVQPWRVRTDRATAAWIVTYGIALAGMNSLFYAAIQTLPLGVAVAIEFLGPLALAIGHSRRLADLGWALLAAGGLAVLFFGDWSASGLSAAAIACALAAGGCWGLYILAGKRAAAVGRQSAVACGTTVAALCTVPFGIAHSGWRLFSPEHLPLASAVALLTSVIPYSLEMIALERLPARVFGVLTSLEPAVAAAFGLLLLHETLPLSLWAGILCIVAASLGTVIGEWNGGSRAA